MLFLILCTYSMCSHACSHTSSHACTPTGMALSAKLAGKYIAICVNFTPLSRSSASSISHTPHSEAKLAQLPAGIWRTATWLPFTAACTPSDTPASSSICISADVPSASSCLPHIPPCSSSCAILCSSSVSATDACESHATCSTTQPICCSSCHDGVYQGAQ